MTKKYFSKNTILSYTRNKHNANRNTLINTSRNKQTKKYNIYTQHAGSNLNPNQQIVKSLNSNKPIRETYNLTHVWYRAWGDMGVPDIYEFKIFIGILYDNIYTNNQLKLIEDSTIIIHCSAGVGRSGVILIILQLMHMIRTTQISNFIITQEVILYAIIHSRTYRMMLVQTIEQFKFICKYFKISDIDINTKIIDEFDRINKKQKDLDKQNKDNTFIPEIVKDAASSVTGKNRYGNIFPYNINRVRIKGDTDYINASLMEPLMDTSTNYRAINIILAQGPNKNTIQDFLQMCFENKTFLIIMLTGLTENDTLGNPIHKCDDYMESANDGSLSQMQNNNSSTKDVLYTQYTLYKETNNNNNKIEYEYTSELTRPPQIPQIPQRPSKSSQLPQRPSKSSQLPPPILPPPRLPPPRLPP